MKKELPMFIDFYPWIRLFYDKLLTMFNKVSLHFRVFLKLIRLLL